MGRHAVAKRPRLPEGRPRKMPNSAPPYLFEIIAKISILAGGRSVSHTTDIVGVASGKSGGSLALEWCRGSSLDQLARRSFELHT
jgi:hypothetical protein